MATEVLTAKTRTANLSRGELMRERKNGRIPAVFFGHGIDSIPLFVDLVEFNRVFDNKGKIFEMTIDGKKKLVNTKTIQYDPQRKHIWHIDFYALKKGVETTVKIPVVLVGEAAGQKDGGSVQQRRPFLEVSGTPMNIPEELEVDVSALGIGDSIHAGDIKPKGDYKIETDSELTVATVAAPQKTEEESEPAATEEPAASEETPKEE